MDIKSVFSKTTYRSADSHGFTCRSLIVNSAEELLQIPSPCVRKSLPQTSIFVVKDKPAKHPNNDQGISLNNEIEFINFSQNEKIIATKALRLLINEIIIKYPNCRFKRDLFETYSEVYKYCFNEDLEKIRSARDLNADVKFVVLSRRHKIHKNELMFKQRSERYLESQPSYQLINFNRSIPRASQMNRKFQKKRIKKILKDTRNKISEKRKVISLVFPIPDEKCVKQPQFNQSRLKSEWKSCKNIQIPKKQDLPIPFKLYKALLSLKPTFCEKSLLHTSRSQAVNPIPPIK